MLWHVGDDEVCAGQLFACLPAESLLAGEKEQDYHSLVGWLKAEEEEVGEEEEGGWHWLLLMLLSAVLQASGLVLLSEPFLPART